MRRAGILKTGAEIPPALGTAWKIGGKSGDGGISGTGVEFGVENLGYEPGFFTPNSHRLPRIPRPPDFPADFS